MSLTHCRPKWTSHCFVNLRYKGSSCFFLFHLSHRTQENAIDEKRQPSISKLSLSSFIYSYIIRYFEGQGLKYNHWNTLFKMTSKLDRGIAWRGVAWRRNVGTWTRCTERRSTRQKEMIPRRGSYIFTDPMLRSKCGARCTRSKKWSRRTKEEG